MTEERSVRVDLGARSYDVLIGPGLLAEAGARIAPLAPGKRVGVVVDNTVARLHLATLQRALAAAGIAAETIVVPAGEGSKSFASLERVTDALLAMGLERRDLVVALGGGVIGDLAGLAAALVKRGLDFVQIPTTLLAQVDSSVGGKTAINARAGKNLVGLFHQPRLVLADLDVLATLPERERRAGYAEIVKIGLIGDAPFFGWCEAHGLETIAGAPQEVVAHAIEVAVRAKAQIVAADEREAGVRALLNLGHTFAHAIEAEVGMDSGAVLHGEAVGCGMAMAFRFSAALGHCARADAERVEAHLKAMGFATRLAQLPGAYSPERMIAAMRHDKKNEGGGLTFILARGIGAAFIARDVDPVSLGAFLATA